MNTKIPTVTYRVVCLFMLCLHAFLLPLVLSAQGTAVDYQRADSLRKTVQGKVHHHPQNIKAIGDQQAFVYLVHTAKGAEFMKVDVEEKSKQAAFDQEKLASALAEASGEKVDAYRLPFQEINFNPLQDSLLFRAFGKEWAYQVHDGGIRTLPNGATPTRGYWGSRRSDRAGEPVKSPDGKWTAYIKNHNVYAKPAQDKGAEFPLSFDGSEGEYYSTFISWSPDSKKLAVNKVRANTEHKIYLIESSPTDQLQPKLQSRDYLKPGDALPQRYPTLFLVEERQQYQVPASLLPNQYDVSARLEWRKDSRGITFEYNKRGHQHYAVFGMDAQTGEARPLIEENSKTFIDYSGKKYRYDVADGKEIIWASERDGWNHLYLYDGLTGKVKNQVTKGDWVVRRVIQVDDEKRRIIFEGSGREKGMDPYFIQYYSVNFDGSGLKALTDGNAHHAATFTADYRYFIDHYSRIDQPSTTVLRETASGRVVMALEKANIEGLLALGLKMPEVFSAKGRDGETDIWGIIVRPSNFDPAKRYPVIEYIYAGPHSSFVPKGFQPLPSAGMQELAELGFIVVQMDGMGTSNRSKAFHDVCWQNLKDAGFPDRIAWIKAAAVKYAYMDVDRVGIYGTSAGGQSSMGALLFYPDFYKVAVSSCGCHDNRMDKIWWNEQWMGYPIGPHYAQSSNVVNAHQLQGKLMLIVGELDDNVDPSSTLQVVNALIKANKNFDFLMVPGMGHSSGGDFGEHKRRDFFVKHLLEVDPPVWEGMVY